MTPVTRFNRRWPVIFLAAFLFLISATDRIQASTNQATLQPTETAVHLTTPTAALTATPSVLPPVDWSDLAVYKKAMKPEFAADVDKFTNGNRYQIVADLKIENDAVIRGMERVRYTNRAPNALNEIVFRLYPNTPMLAGRMDINGLTVDGRTVQPVLSELASVMTVPLASPLATGASVEFVVDFTTVMTRELDAAYGRFGFRNGVVSSTAWYPTLSVYDVGRGWWTSMPSPQGDPAYTETGLYNVWLTVPAAMTVAMSGTVIETTPNGNETVTYHDVTGPMRDFAFSAGERYAISSTDVDGTRINAVHYKDAPDPNLDATDDVLKIASQSLQTFNRTFGVYP